MGKTSIEWTDHSVNPIRCRNVKTGAVGHFCEKVSTGCKNCYSSNFQPRFKMPRFGGDTGGTVEVGSNGAVRVSDELEVFLDESKLQEVLRRRKPTMWFWLDMSDLFGWWVPDEWIDKCFAAMALTTQHTHQVLTKRPERMAEYLSDRTSGPLCDVSAQSRVANIAEVIASEMGEDTSSPWWDVWIERWPLSNVHLGTSIENQQTANERLGDLTHCPAAARFVSLEPMLGHVDLRLCPHPDDVLGCVRDLDEDSPVGCVRCETGRHWINGFAWNWYRTNRYPDVASRHCGIDQVIIGVESRGQYVGRLGEFASEADWIDGAIDVVRQCQAAGVAPFVKQCPINGKVSHDPAEWPDALRSQEFPKVDAMV